MAAQWITEHIAKLTGLDEETVASQITPSVQSLDSKLAVQRHLEGLCGYSPEAKTFISTYLSARFGATKPPPSSASSLPRTIKIGASGPSLVRNAPPSSKSNKPRGGSGASTPIAASGRSSPNLVDAFGGKLAGGSVYIKGQMGEEDLRWGGKHIASSSKSASVSGTTTPDHSTVGRQKSSGTLASDMGPSQRSGGAKPKSAMATPAVNQQNEEAKSDAVKKLEKMMADLLMDGDETQETASGGKQRTSKNKEPCYCQARLHPLSAYTPSCTSCGLVLCSLHLPHLPCPSCERPLLTSLARHRVFNRLQVELDGVLRAEAEEREKIEQAKREMVLAESGGGAFPALTGGKTAASVTGASVNARKVLTLGGGAGTKSSAAKITTYTKNKIAEGVMPPKSAPNEPRVVRVSRPPTEPLSEREANALWESDESWRNSSGRRFARMEEQVGVMVPAAIYIPVKEVREMGEEDGGKKRKKKKGKGVDGAVVPGAG